MTSLTLILIMLLDFTVAGRWGKVSLFERMYPKTRDNFSQLVY